VDEDWPADGFGAVRREFFCRQTLGMKKLKNFVTLLFILRWINLSAKAEKSVGSGSSGGFRQLASKMW
jgi:hypothetical protein